LIFSLRIEYNRIEWKRIEQNRIPNHGPFDIIVNFFSVGGTITSATRIRRYHGGFHLKIMFLEPEGYI
jgi:hypothetical protein